MTGISSLKIRNFRHFNGTGEEMSFESNLVCADIDTAEAVYLLTNFMYPYVFRNIYAGRTGREPKNTRELWSELLYNNNSTNMPFMTLLEGRIKDWKITINMWEWRGIIQKELSDGLSECVVPDEGETNLAYEYRAVNEEESTRIFIDGNYCLHHGQVENIVSLGAFALLDVPSFPIHFIPLHLEAYQPNYMPILYGELVLKQKDQELAKETGLSFSTIVDGTSTELYVRNSDSIFPWYCLPTEEQEKLIAVAHDLLYPDSILAYARSM